MVFTVGLLKEQIASIGIIPQHTHYTAFAPGISIAGEYAFFIQHVAQEKERQLTEIIRDENLKENETRKFMEIAFRDGAVKTTGTDIDKLLPPMSRFGGGNRAEKKQGVIAKLLGFFERFFGIG